MNLLRRSFAREALSLYSTVESDFHGQIQLLPFDESNINRLVMIVTPEVGPYAHGSFQFSVLTCILINVQK